MSLPNAEKQGVAQIVIVPFDDLGDLALIRALDQKVIEFRKLRELYSARRCEIHETLIDDKFLCGVFMEKIILFHLKENKMEGDQGIDGEGPLAAVNGAQIGEKDIVSQRGGDKLAHSVTFDFTLDRGFSGYLMEFAYGDFTKGDDQISPVGGHDRLKIDLIEMHLVASLLPAEMRERLAYDL
jgi:hypothetical protein